MGEIVAMMMLLILLAPLCTAALFVGPGDEYSPFSASYQEDLSKKVTRGHVSSDD